MIKKNGQNNLMNRIITLTLAAFATTNGIFSIKLNAKADNNDSNDKSTLHNHYQNQNYTTLVSASNVSTHNNSSSNQPKKYHNNKVNTLTSNILLNYIHHNSINRIEASSMAASVHKHSAVRRSFTSSGNYYHSLSDVTSTSSNTQPGYKSLGSSSGLDKPAIQNQYPAEFQSLSNAYQNASMQVTVSKSKANDANHYLSACESLNSRNYQNTFNWHYHSASTDPKLHQSYLTRQYQQLSNSAVSIYEESTGLNNVSYLAKQINQIKDPLYRNDIDLKKKTDAQSLTSINQSLADNNYTLSLANHKLNFNHEAFHKIHSQNHFMTLNHNLAWNQTPTNQDFISQVGNRGVIYDNGNTKVEPSRIFKRFIDNLANNLHLNALKQINNCQINGKYGLLSQLYLHNIVIYVNHDGNLIKVITSNQPINIHQGSCWAFPLRNTDYPNFVNTLTNTAIKENYSLFKSKNITKLNQIKQNISSIMSELDSLKNTNQLLTKDENKALNQWKLDSFLLSEPDQASVLNQFYNRYLNNLINRNNRVYHGVFGIRAYLFDPNVNSFKLLIGKSSPSGTDLNLSPQDLSQIKRAINSIYKFKKTGVANKYKAIFQSNNIMLPQPIFQFLKSHNYQLANGQSMLRNIILCFVKSKKEAGNLNLFIKFKRCDDPEKLNHLDGNDLNEIIPILHNYYPLGNQRITNVTKSILKASLNNYHTLRNGLQSASEAINDNINNYQASLSNFVNFSGVNKELTSAKYFANSYSSDIKSNQTEVSLAEIALDNFYVSHSPKGSVNVTTSFKHHNDKYKN